MSASAILKLQAAGFSTEQVTALADLIDTQAAGKSDLEGVEHRLELRAADAKAELKGGIADVKSELKGDIAAVKSELKDDIADVKSTLRVHNWMIGFVLAFQIAIFLKLFMH